FFYLGRKTAQVKVAGHGFNPGVGNTDDRLFKIGIGESDRFEHSARRRTVASFRDFTTAMFWVHGVKDYYRECAYVQTRRLDDPYANGLFADIAAGRITKEIGETLLRVFTRPSDERWYLHLGSRRD